MAWYNPFKKEPEARAVTQSNPEFLRVLFGDSIDQPVVSRSTILKTAPGWAAVNFLAGSLAGLPLQMYRKTEEGRETVSGPFADMLHFAVNDTMTSFDWRFQSFSDVFTTGRAFTYIERSSSGTPVNLYRMNPAHVTVKDEGFKLTYCYSPPGLKPKFYEPGDVLDIAFMKTADGLGHIGPVTAGGDAFKLALSVAQYSNKFLANGGVPPFIVSGDFQTAQEMERASNDIAAAVRKSAREDRQALTIPRSLEFTQIGSDPDRTQMIETQRWAVEQIARLYGLPPTFLQDLTHGTYSNTEQQDLHFVKHTLKRWVEQFEQELNLKLFGRGNNRRYAELNVDGLLRGDFNSRMSGYATGIQNAFLKPSEARRMENLPGEESGDQLFIQSGTVPVESAGEALETDSQGNESDES